MPGAPGVGWFGRTPCCHLLLAVTLLTCVLSCGANGGHWHGDHWHSHDDPSPWDLAPEAGPPSLRAVTGGSTGGAKGGRKRPFVCGSSHPNITRHFKPEVTVPQGYHTVEHARRLTDQGYPTGPGGAFLPLSDASSAGLAAPMRIVPVWTAIESAEFSGVNSGAAARQCIAADRTISVECVIGGSPSCTSPCKDEDVVAPGNERMQVIQERITWAVEYFRSALSVKPVLDPIVVDSYITSTFNLGALTVPNADLVVLVTARPAPFAQVAAYATCLQRDQYGRCTVGRFNWVPNALEPEKRYTAASIVSERHTALHEIVHILGGINPGPTFIDAAGLPQANVFTVVPAFSAHYNKPTTYISTPRVRARSFGAHRRTRLWACRCVRALCPPTPRPPHTLPVVGERAGGGHGPATLQLFVTPRGAPGRPATGYGCALGGACHGS
jgi:hypothetical protein